MTQDSRIQRPTDAQIRQQTIKRTFAPWLLETGAYHVPDASYSVKLDAMESPHQLPHELLTGALSTLHTVDMHRYPDAAHVQLKSVVRSFFGIKNPSIDLLFGNGSDELIQLLLISQLAHKRTILAPEPSFVMYKTISEWLQLPYCALPLRDDFSLHIERILALLAQHKPGLVLIAQPNNPTGNLFTTEDIRTIVQVTDALVLLDEAYFAFHNENYLPLLQDYPNLLIMRTFSKLGFAGLRLGCLIGHHDWIEQCNKLRLPYNINSATLALATHIFGKHKSTIDTQVAAIITQRTWLMNELKAIDGVHPYPSAANFICFSVPEGQANSWFEQLKQQGILLKNLHSAHPMLQHCLRVTVGTQEECRAFIATLQSIADYI